MLTKKIRPRCTIQLLNVRGELVPILDDGASITPGTRHTKYREVWTEEEDLDYVYRQPVTAADGTASTVAWPGSVHGNFGYELLVAESTRRFSLRIDYFTVLPSVANGQLALAYEPKSASVVGVLGRGGRMRLDIALQSGFSEEAGRPDLEFLRVTCGR